MSKNFHHNMPIVVRFSDLDAIGHVNNTTTISYFEASFVRYLLNLGIGSQLEGWQSTGFIVARIECDFRRPIFYDQEVIVSSRVIKFGNSSMKMEHHINADNHLTTEGYTILVRYDYHTSKSKPIEPEIRSKIEKFEQCNF